jgi:hypothetical protein
MRKYVLSGVSDENEFKGLLVAAADPASVLLRLHLKADRLLDRS